MKHVTDSHRQPQSPSLNALTPEWRERFAAIEAQRDRAIDFIQVLMQSMKGIDRKCDQRLAKLKAKLEAQQSLTSLDNEVSQLEKQLQQSHRAIQEAISQTQVALNLGSKQLLNLEGLPEETMAALSALLSTPYSHGVADHQRRVLTLLDCYRQAYKLQQKSNMPRSTRLNRGIDSVTCAPEAHNQIVDELQRLITELNFTGAIGEQLQAIRRQLLVGIAPSALVDICLTMIELIIEGNRQERKASQEYLQLINQSLSSIQIAFSRSLDEGKALLNGDKQALQQLTQSVQNIEQSLQQNDDLNQLQSAMRQQSALLQQLLQERVQANTRQQHLLSHLEAMELTMRQMQDKTHQYQSNLSLQKHNQLLDPLTQVHNRQALEERLDLEFKRWQRYRTPLALVIIDIDHFKKINDNYGHIAGDKALKIVAKELQNSLRDTDFIARFGGEEFALLLPNVNAETLSAPLEKLRLCVAQIPFHFRDHKVVITISLGATLFKEHDSPIEAFERADKALYQAKHLGRNQAIIF